MQLAIPYVNVKLLLEERVHFYLIQHGLDFKGFTKINQNMRITICHADGFQFPIFIELFKTFPRIDIITHRLVEQHEVDIIYAEAFHR